MTRISVHSLCALVGALALFAVARGHADGPAASALAIAAVNDGTRTPSVIQVTGLSGAELSAIRQAGLDEPAWQALFSVRVAGPDLPPLAGHYVVTVRAIEFRPQFPFDLGRAYSAHFDPAKLPTPRPDRAVDLTLTFAAPPRSPSTTVTAIYPSSAIWPENMLRFYIEFSAPMSRTGGITFIHLLDDAEHEIPDALLAVYSDLWNENHTRLTVLFDPGRVKRGVGPNVKMGRALVDGRRYAIAIDRAWPDGQGQPLEAAFRREFRAGPAEYRALSTGDWRIAAPHAGTREPLVVSFPRPLDHAILERAVGATSADGTSVEGNSSVGPDEMSWTLTPRAEWRKQSYHLVVLTLLEDPAGNRIGRAFEVLPTDLPQPDAGRESVSVTFNVK